MKTRTAHEIDEGSESPHELEDLDLQVEEYDDESQFEIEQLRKKLLELEANQGSRNPLKTKRSELGPLRKTHLQSSPPERRGHPTEGLSLGTFNGKTDLDTFLVRFETCSRHFGWSKSEKVFHLINALTDSAEPIVKEVGPFGTLEGILELLQSRFGNILRIETFHADLRKRRRRPNETLQDLYLDLCRLRALATSEVEDERYPEMYFRKIFVDSLNDRELRRAVLVQNPGTMEEAYRVATRLEAINAYETPVSEFNRNRPNLRQLDLENETLPSSKQGPELDEHLARRLVELENEVQSLRADAQRRASCSPNTPSNSRVRQSVQDPGSMMTDGSTRDSRTASSTHETYVPIGRRKEVVRQVPRKCYNCGEIGHIKQDCIKPRFSDHALGHGPRGPRSDHNANMASDKIHGKENGLSSPTRIRREAYLEVQLGSQKVLALLDSGCEQSVVGRTLIRKVPLEPTNEKLSTADGTDIPLLGETTIYFSVSGLQTSCRVVVTDVLTELILGIDWLRRNQCVWDFGSSSFVMKGRQSQLSCKRPKQTVRRIILEDDVVIPGQHTANVSILVTRSTLGHEDRDWGLTRKIKDADLVIANTIYDRDQVRSCCQVWNISDLLRRLKKGSEIGWAEPIEIIETEQSGVSDKRSRQKYETVQDGPLDLRQIKTIPVPDSGMTGMRSPDSADSGGTEPRSQDSSDSGTGPSDFIQDMLDHIDLDLTDEQNERVHRLLEDNRGVFSTSEFDLGRTDLVRHKIDTGSYRPFKQPLRRHPMAYLPVIDEHVDKMLANNVCEPSNSPWASNVVLVKKSDGTLRFCVDYRQLNSFTVKDSYPLPRIDTCFDALGDAKYFSTLDLRQGYWQVENDPETADKTTFITGRGAFKFKVLPFGL